MRKAILALCLAVAYCSADAQSSVTLYGRIDNGLQYETGLPQGHVFGTESGNFGESEFGAKGSEDLGSGTKAVFHLEMGLNTQTGSFNNGSLFGRAATVGLTNDNYGSLNVGNMGAGEIQQDSYDLDPQYMQFWSISALVRGRNWSQTGNGIEYTSPSMDGLVLKGQYDLANSTTWNAGDPGSAPGQLGASSGFGSAQGRSDGLKAQYNTGNYELQVLFDEIRDQYGQFSNVYLASRSIMAGGTYVFGSLKFYGGFQHLSAPDASNVGYFGTGVTPTLPNGLSLPTAVNHEWAGVSWQATSSTNLVGAIYHANANNGNGNATMYTLSGQYNLSRRTFLYTEVAYIHNSSTSNVGLGDGYSDPYGPNSNNDPYSGNTNNSPNYGHGQLGVTAGIMHYF